MSEIKVNSIKGVGASQAAISIDNSSGTCTANITNNLSNRRININGAMMVQQRGNSTGNTTNGYYGPDRIKSTIYGGTFSHSRPSSGSSLPEFPSCFRIDCTSAASAPSSGQEVKIGYEMEGQDVQHLNYGSSSAKKTTLSFYVRSNKTETYTVWFYRPDGSRHNAVNFSISSADTWEKKTITIVGDTSDAIANDNTLGLKFDFILSSGVGYKSGSALNGSWADLVDVNRYAGNTGTFGQSTNDVFDITGIQFEVSDHATDFEHRSFADELARCQRYYQVIFDSSMEQTYFVPAFMWSNTHLKCIHRLPVEMRATPTLECTSGTNAYRFYRNNTYDNLDDLTLQNSSKRAIQLQNDTDMSGSAGHAGGLFAATGTVGYIAITSEL